MFYFNLLREIVLGTCQRKRENSKASIFIPPSFPFYSFFNAIIYSLNIIKLENVIKEEFNLIICYICFLKCIIKTKQYHSVYVWEQKKTLCYILCNLIHKFHNVIKFETSTWKFNNKTAALFITNCCIFFKLQWDFVCLKLCKIQILLSWVWNNSCLLDLWNVSEILEKM